MRFIIAAGIYFSALTAGFAADGALELLPPNCTQYAKRFEFPVVHEGRTINVPILISQKSGTSGVAGDGRTGQRGTPSLEAFNVRIGVTDFSAKRMSVNKKDQNGQMRRLPYLRLEKTTSDPDRRTVIESNRRSQKCINEPIVGDPRINADRTTRAYYCHSIVKAGYKGIPEMEISQNTGIASKYPDGFCSKYPDGRCPVGRILDVYPDGVDPMAHRSGGFIRINWEGGTLPGEEGNLRIDAIDGYEKKTYTSQVTGITTERSEPKIKRSIIFDTAKTAETLRDLRKVATEAEKRKCLANAPKSSGNGRTGNR